MVLVESTTKLVAERVLLSRPYQRRTGNTGLDVAAKACHPLKSRRKQVVLLTPRLSVVIVNYRQWDETGELVRRLRSARCCRRGSAEIVVIDNHSPPHPQTAKLRRRFGVSLRRWGRNRGFARAVNEGCRLSQGEWVLLLNPDVTITESFLDQVAAFADRLTKEAPRAGVVGFRLWNSDGSHQFSAGNFPTLFGTIAGMAWPRSKRKYCAVNPAGTCAVPWVTGCCLLLRRECFRDLGGFDERFFLYYEDVDFCRRARSRGWSIWYEPSLSVIHHHPLHSRPVPPHLRFVTRHALLTYAAKHWKAWQFHALARIVQAESWLRQCWAGSRGQADSVAIFSELSRLAGDLARGRRAAARRRLEAVVRHAER